jgi:hypothetical protein
VLSEWAAPAETVRIANAANDYRVEGRDAAQASLLFGRTAGWLYDRPESFVAVFDAAVAERGLHARLVRAPGVPHRQRVDHALSRPEHAGTVEFHGSWAAGIGVLPADVAFPARSRWVARRCAPS